MPPIDQDRPEAEALAQVYLTIKRGLIEAGYGPEIYWQESRDANRFSESDFLREAAWVILCSGFRERVVAAKFHAISAAFLSWESAQAVVLAHRRCRTRALRVFRNPAKIDAILDVASYLHETGFDTVWAECQQRPVTFLNRFRFVGPVTALHLAKNLGFDVAKPDRHLLRVAAATGHESPEALCRELANALDEPVGVVDLVIWRHAVTTSDYEDVWGQVRRIRTMTQPYAASSSPPSAGYKDPVLEATVRYAHPRRRDAPVSD